MQVSSRPSRAPSSPVPSQSLPTLTGQQPSSPSSPSNAEVLLLHFPNAPWPAPPTFQAELRRGLKALGATCLNSVAICLHEGGVIAELMGLRDAIAELRSLPLLNLFVLNYGVELVRSSRARMNISDDFAEERELLSELQFAARKAELMMSEASSDNKVRAKLVSEEQAFARADDDCRVLRRALSDSEFVIQGIQQEVATMSALSGGVCAEEVVWQKAEQSRRVALQIETERLHAVIASSESLLEDSMRSGSNTPDRHAFAMKALLQNLEKLEGKGNPPVTDTAILLQRCAEEHQAVAALRFDIEYHTQQAALAKEESRASDLQEVLQDLAGEHRLLVDRFSDEQKLAMECKKRLSVIESLDDPWDRSRAIIDAGVEIRSLMQEQEMAANVVSEAIALGSQPTVLAAAAGDVTTLAAKASRKALESQRLVSDAGLRFSEELRVQRQNTFVWEQLADQRQEHIESLEAHLHDVAPSSLNDRLKIEMGKIAHWEMVADEHQRFAAQLQQDRQEAVLEKSKALAAEAHAEHATRAAQLRTSVNALAVAQVVDQVIDDSSFDSYAAVATAIEDKLTVTCPTGLKEAVCALAAEEARESAKVRELSVYLGEEEARAAELRGQVKSLRAGAEEHGTARREMYALQELVDMTRHAEYVEAQQTQELAVQLTAAQVTRAKFGAEVDSLKNKLETFEMQSEALEFQLEERHAVNAGLEFLENNAIQQLGVARAGINERGDACHDLETEVEAMCSQIALLKRSLSETRKLELHKSTEVYESHELAFEQNSMKLEEEKLYHSEALYCRTVEAEVAASMARHATSICEAKLETAKAMASHDAECVRARSLASREAALTEELGRALDHAGGVSTNYVFHQEGWEMAIARQEGRSQVLQDIVNSQALEISELRNKLFKEELSMEDLHALGDEE